MKKIIKNLIFVIFIFLSFIFSAIQVSANSISSIDMDVYIDSSGDASITETWKVYLNQGTEGYRTYTNLGNSSISNFSVTDEMGIQYKSLSSWDTSSSFEQKAYKSGLHYISNGVELCWGISKYGNKTYTLKYTVSNFVMQYIDTQGIYFNFIDLEQDVGNVTISIYSNQSFSLDNARIWAFGNNGTILFDNGKIVLNSNGTLSSSQYMVALVRFESNLFNTSNLSSKSFDDIYVSAMSDVDEEKINFNIEFFLQFISTVSPVIAFLSFFGLIIDFTYELISSSRKKTDSLDFGMPGKILPSDDMINYYREIPCCKDLERAYWVAYNYNVVSIDTLKEGIIGAILLKWIKEGFITVSKTKKGFFNFKDNNYAIDFSNMQCASNEIENILFKMLKEATGFNKILEAQEFEKWCKKNYSKIQNWFFKLNLLEQKELEKQGFIITQQKEFNGKFSRKKMITTKQVNSQLREEAIQLKGLKKFLLDFSMMPEKEYFEVHIWEEYLIYAQLLGIADKVEEQFSQLYPNFNQQTKLNTEITTVAIRNMANLCYKGYEAGMYKSSMRSYRRSSSSSHDYSGRSRDSGGGGRSYSSGGRSSGGSSGGGFR